MQKMYNGEVGSMVNINNRTKKIFLTNMPREKERAK